MNNINYLTKLKKFLALLVLSVVINCASILTVTDSFKNPTKNKTVIYSGVQADYDFIWGKNRSILGGILFFDLPLSFVCDTILLPITIPYDIYLVYVYDDKLSEKEIAEVEDRREKSLKKFNDELEKSNSKNISNYILIREYIQKRDIQKINYAFEKFNLIAIEKEIAHIDNYPEKDEIYFERLNKIFNQESPTSLYELLIGNDFQYSENADILVKYFLKIKKDEHLKEKFLTHLIHFTPSSEQAKKYNVIWSETFLIPISQNTILVNEFIDYQISSSLYYSTDEISENKFLYFLKLLNKDKLNESNWWVLFKFATLIGNRQAIEITLSHYTKLSIKKNPLCFAIEKQKPKAVERILSYNSDFLRKPCDVSSMDPLQYAFLKYSTQYREESNKVILTILKFGASVYADPHIVLAKENKVDYSILESLEKRIEN